MKIAQSQVTLAGASYRHYEQSRSERLVAWSDGQRLEAAYEERGELTAAAVDVTRISADARARASGDKALDAALAQLGELADGAKSASQDNAVDADDPLAKYGPVFGFKILLIEALTGRKFIFRTADEIAQDREAAAQRLAASKDALGGADAATAAAREGWGVRYDSHTETREVEKASFASSGVVQTADGQTITFQANLEMSRERITVKDVHFAAGDALKDPLVINFSGTAAELTDTKTSFDLNADGANEEISFLKAGSGFLVLDENGDGVVNDGSELFGPRTGDGFAELAAYDDDQNGWIDEADAVYTRLGVWSRTGETDVLATLKERNVGAIYLNSAATQFSLRDSQDATQGQVRSTGVYLTDDGAVGTVQQVDLKT